MMNLKALLKSMLLRKFATALLLVQLVLTLGLVVNTVLLTLDAREKLNNPLGFDIDNLIVAELLPTSGAYHDTSYYMSITHQDIRKLTALDGVISAAYYNQLPIQRGGSNGNFQDINSPEDKIIERDLGMVPFFYSSELGLSNLGVELIAGRQLTVDDDVSELVHKGQTEGLEQNIIITESLAKAVYPDKSALGQLTNNGRIVGIAKDFAVSPSFTGRHRYFGVFGHFMFARASFTQSYVIQVEPGQMENVRKQISATILSVQPERDVLDVYSMRERLQQFYSEETGLASLFAMLCLLMILVTVVSSFAHAHFYVSQQRKLIGIRRALGATKKDIMLYVFSENWLMSLFASLLGVAAVVGINMALSQVIAIDKPDSLLYLLAVATIFITGTLATWLPAYKTTKIAPVTATHTV
ncbi:MAG: FtsX-like permease family protein [Alteromonadaceae bacterium]|nr:FtsX-like permease family protein [Alteromonadaceae bacterium]